MPGKSMAERQVMGPSWGKGHRLGLEQAGKVRMPMAVVKWHEHLTGSREQGNSTLVSDLLYSPLAE